MVGVEGGQMCKTCTEREVAEQVAKAEADRVAAERAAKAAADAERRAKEVAKRDRKAAAEAKKAADVAEKERVRSQGTAAREEEKKRKELLRQMQVVTEAMDPNAREDRIKEDYAQDTQNETDEATDEADSTAESCIETIRTVLTASTKADAKWLQFVERSRRNLRADARAKVPTLTGSSASRVTFAVTVTLGDQPDIKPNFVSGLHWELCSLVGLVLEDKNSLGALLVVSDVFDGAGGLVAEVACPHGWFTKIKRANPKVLSGCEVVSFTSAVQSARLEIPKALDALPVTDEFAFSVGSKVLVRDGEETWKHGTVRCLNPIKVSVDALEKPGEAETPAYVFDECMPSDDCMKSAITANMQQVIFLKSNLSRLTLSECKVTARVAPHTQALTQAKCRNPEYSIPTVTGLVEINVHSKYTRVEMQITVIGGAHDGRVLPLQDEITSAGGTVVVDDSTVRFKLVELDREIYPASLDCSSQSVASVGSESESDDDDESDCDELQFSATATITTWLLPWILARRLAAHHRRFTNRLKADDKAYDDGAEAASSIVNLTHFLKEVIRTCVRPACWCDGTPSYWTTFANTGTCQGCGTVQVTTGDCSDAGGGYQCSRRGHHLCWSCMGSREQFLKTNSMLELEGRGWGSDIDTLIEFFRKCPPNANLSDQEQQERITTAATRAPRKPRTWLPA
jgi:hypothetical protein